MGFHGLWLVSMVFQGGFMVSHGFWLVSMVFQRGFMFVHSFWLVSMIFQGGFMVYHSFVGKLSRNAKKEFQRYKNANKQIL